VYANPTTGTDGGTAQTRQPAGPQIPAPTGHLDLPHEDAIAQDPTRPERVAVYVRTAPGTLHPAVLKVHVRRLRDYIDSRTGWAFTGLVIHDAASAATLDRPGLNDALAAAHNGAFEVLLVDRPDRLTRSMHSLDELVRQLSRCDVTVHTAADGHTVTATEAEPSASLDRQAASIAAWLRVHGWPQGIFTDTERTSRIARVSPGRTGRRAPR
jgi:hypothetical protein